MTSPIIIPTRQRGWGAARSHNGSIQDAVIPGAVVTAIGTFTCTANTDYFSPWRIYTPIKIDQLYCEVTLASGTNLRIGLYAADRNWQPVGPPLVDSGNLSSASTGLKTYTPGTPIVLQPGRYVSVLNTDGTPNMRTYLGNMESQAFFSTMGSSLSMVLAGLSRTYAAFPNPSGEYGAVSTPNSALGWIQMIAFRLESLL